MSTMKFTSWQDLDGNEVANSAYPPGLVLVKQQTIGSAVSSVTVNDAFSSAFDNYKVVINGVGASVVGSGRFAFGTSSTSSSYYGSFSWDLYNGASAAVSHSNNSGFLYFCEFATATNTNATLEVMNPYNANYSVMSTIGYGAGYYFNGAGEHGAQTSHTAFTLSTTTGTFSGGTIRVYGYQQ